MEFTIHQHQLPSGTSVQVVRDDLLPGGTKRRGLTFLRNLSPTECLYAGPSSAGGFYCLAKACKDYGHSCILFLVGKETSLSVEARKLGAEIRWVRGKIDQAEKKAKQWSEDRGSLLFEFGLKDGNFVQCLADSIAHNWEGAHPRRLWIACGSCTTLNVLYKLFPKTEFHAIQVGRTLWPDLLDLERTTVYVSPLHFQESARVLPPWPSFKNYDAKIYEFLLTHAQEGDYVWNFATDHF